VPRKQLEHRPAVAPVRILRSEFVRLRAAGHAEGLVLNDLDVAVAVLEQRDLRFRTGKGGRR
jgi:hypothetical protein